MYNQGGGYPQQQFQQPQQQQGYAPNGGYPSGGYYGPITVPQNAPSAGAPFAQQVANGNFPYHNRVELVGQVFGLGQDTGIQWRNGNNGKEGHLEVKLKLRKSWQSQSGGGVKQSKVTVVAYGQLGQTLGNQIRTGTMLRVVGEVSVTNYRAQSGRNAGNWVTNCQIILRDGRNSEPPYEVLGMLPVIDERPPQNNFGGGGGGFQQGGQGWLSATGAGRVPAAGRLSAAEPGLSGTAAGPGWVPAGCPAAAERVSAARPGTATRYVPAASAPPQNQGGYVAPQQQQGGYNPPNQGPSNFAPPGATQVPQGGYVQPAQPPQQGAAASCLRTSRCPAHLPSRGPRVSSRVSPNRAVMASPSRVTAAQSGTTTFRSDDTWGWRVGSGRPWAAPPLILVRP